MSSGVQPARLTIHFREPVPRHVVLEIVRQAHAAGVTSATIHRGSTGPVRETVIPTPRSLSLAEVEGTTIVVIAAEPELATFAATLGGSTSSAELVLEVDGHVRELRQRDGGALAR